MNTPKIIFRVVLSWMSLLAAQIVAGMMIHPKSPPNPHPLLFVLVYDALIVLPVAAAALRSDWRGWKLLPALFVVPAVISVANWIEGVWYLPNVGIDWRATLIFSMVSLAMASLLWLLVFRGAPVPESPVSSALPQRELPQKLWRFAVCSACYVFLYFMAGMIIFPFVRDYYATQHLPSGGQIIAMQFLVRGPMFIVVCLVLLRMFRMPHLSGAFAVGLAFTFISGVAALIMPNGIFPDTVRWAHFCEVTSSNFVFGFIVGWVWGHAQRVGVLKAAHA